MIQGATLAEKASKFIIKAQDEERIISDQIDVLKNKYFPVYKDVNIICLAANYLQRFYLVNSIFIYEPKAIILSCLYLAVKVSEIAEPLRAFCHKTKADPVKLLQNEQILVQALGHNLHVHTPIPGIQNLLSIIELEASVRD